LTKWVDKKIQTIKGLIERKNKNEKEIEREGDKYRLVEL
jgi:hypothetical protein